MLLNHKTNPNPAPNPTPNPAPNPNPSPFLKLNQEANPNPAPTPNPDLNPNPKPSPFLQWNFFCLFIRKSLYSKPYEINHIDYLNMVPYYEFSLSLLVVIIWNETLPLHSNRLNISYPHNILKIIQSMYAYIANSKHVTYWIFLRTLGGHKDWDKYNIEIGYGLLY